MKKWNYVYGNNTIEVNNSALKTELSINGQVVDKKEGLDLFVNLKGVLDNGENIIALIYTNPSLKDINGVKCDLFVIKEKIEPISES